MEKNKEKHTGTIEDPQQKETYQPGQTTSPEEGLSTWNRVKAKIIRAKKTIYRLDQIDESRCLIEDLSPWVAVKRFLIAVDNVIAAGMFSIYVSWTNNYAEGNLCLDIVSSLCKSVKDITSHLSGEIPYFLFYLFMFWRAPRLTKVLHLNYYFNKKVFLGGAIIVFIVFDAISAGYLKVHLRDFWVGDIRESLSQDYPVLKRQLLQWSVFLILFLYRRIYLLVWR